MLLFEDVTVYQACSRWIWFSKNVSFSHIVYFPQQSCNMELCCCLRLSAHCVSSFQNKDLLAIFSFLRNSCWKVSNMRTENEIVNPCIVTFWLCNTSKIFTVYSYRCFKILFWTSKFGVTFKMRHFGMFLFWLYNFF